MQTSSFVQGLTLIFKFTSEIYWARNPFNFDQPHAQQEMLASGQSRARAGDFKTCRIENMIRNQHFYWLMQLPCKLLNLNYFELLIE